MSLFITFESFSIVFIFETCLVFSCVFHILCLELPRWNWWVPRVRQSPVSFAWKCGIKTLSRTVLKLTMWGQAARLQHEKSWCRTVKPVFVPSLYPYWRVYCWTLEDHDSRLLLVETSWHLLKRSRLHALWLGTTIMACFPCTAFICWFYFVHTCTWFINLV